MTQETGLVKQQLGITGIPQSFSDIKGLSEAFVKSGMFEDIKGIYQAIVKIQAGIELGLPPVYSMQNINMIRGKLVGNANLLALLVKKSGRYNYRIIEHTEQICSIEFFEIENGKAVSVGKSTFSMDDAKRANLVKPDSGWVKYPRAMLFSRAISQGARLYCPDAIGGVYTDEEMKSISVSTQELPIEPVTEVETETVEQEKPEEQPAEKATEAQIKKIFACAMGNWGLSREETGEQLQKLIKERFGKASSKELTKAEASSLIQQIEGKEA